MKADAQVQQDVMTALNWESSIGTTRIGVEVSDGVVTLAGHAHSFAEKWNAGHAARKVAGVKALVVEIDVDRPGQGRRSDIDIARAAGNILAWRTYGTRDRVKVAVDNGWITLSGDVDWSFQRRAANAAVRHLVGVRGVNDLIAVNPHAPAQLATLQPETSGKFEPR